MMTIITARENTGLYDGYDKLLDETEERKGGKRKTGEQKPNHMYICYCPEYITVSQKLL